MNTTMFDSGECCVQGELNVVKMHVCMHDCMYVCMYVCESIGMYMTMYVL